MSALPKTYMTPEEYLKFERESEIKHEYFDGEVIESSRAKHHHYHLTTGNIAASLHGQLRKTPYRVFTNQMRIKVSEAAFYSYPDVLVSGVLREFEDDVTDTLLNPRVIIEVYTPSSEIYDRGKKFQLYRKMESLQEYVLIAQDSARVEHYARHGEQWILTDFSGRDSVLKLASIDCALTLDDVYENVAFEGG